MRKTLVKTLFLTIVLLSLIALSVSCGMAGAQTASPLPPTLISPSPSPIPPATTGQTPTLIPPASIVRPTPTSSPSATVSSEPILPSWTAPQLSSETPPADLSDIAARLLPSVVSINVDISTTDFTGQSNIQPGSGSGWIIDANGLIVTNNHVVENAQNISISLSDGRTFPAQQVVADSVADLAVIKINATGLPAVKVGDSSKLKQGMMVIAIGNALGQGLSVTAGWVSRLGVSLTIPGTGSTSTVTLFDLLEMSAPINPGNSGGPLINMLGEVVGITNAKLITTGVEAVGYAISVKTALPILQQLVQTGGVVRPYMGVSIQDIDASIASVYGLAVNKGALISQVSPGGPAAQAGLQSGDVIVKINDTAITSAADAIQAILSSQVGQTVTITYYRGQTQSTAQVKLIQNPNS